MKKIACIIALALTGCLPLSSAYADAELSQFIAAKVQRANHLQLDDKLDQAVTLLTELQPRSDYDKAFVQRMLGVFIGNKVIRLKRSQA